MVKKIERLASIEELVRMLRDDAKEIVAICEELETARTRASESRPLQWIRNEQQELRDDE